MSEIITQEIREILNALLESQKENSRLFKETDAKFKETDAKFKETDAQSKASRAELDARFKDTDVKFKETDVKFKETDAKFKETDKKIKAAFDLFTNQWGRLMESLVEGDLVNLLRQRGIQVEHTSTRAKGRRNEEDYEFDIIAVNTIEIVVTEVKTSLRPDDVKNFKNKLAKVKIFMPEYTNYRVYGAIAYLQEHSQAAKMAEHDGLFIVKATGSSASIANATDFKPKAW